MTPVAAKNKKLSPGEQIPSRIAQQVDASLAAWFLQSGRSLHFRESTDPYAIMVSEFMLQQTTVAVVEPYFKRFMEQFPTVSDLANSSETDVLAAWAGLGYYRRARQLHAAANLIAGTSDKGFSDDVRQLIKLPGFGRYTAGAVVSQAYDLPAPVLETNTVRVFARLAGIQGIIGRSSYMNQLWDISESFVKHARSPRIFNRAAMELGALICRPKPRCEICPVQSLCLGFRSGNPELLPQPAPRRESVSVNMLALVIQNSADKFALQQIPAGEWHAGMWQFPAQRLEHDNIDEDHAVNFASSSLQIPIKGIRPLMKLRYQVTHHRITCHVFRCTEDAAHTKTPHDNSSIQFLSLHELSKLPMGSAQNKLRQAVINMKTMDKNL